MKVAKAPSFACFILLVLAPLSAAAQEPLLMRTPVAKVPLDLNGTNLYCPASRTHFFYQSKSPPLPFPPGDGSLHGRASA